MVILCNHVIAIERSLGADEPIHAVEFSVIEQGETVSRVEAIHLKGVPQAKLRLHIKNVLGVLKAQFGQELAVSQGRQPVKLCPLCLKEADPEQEIERAKRDG